MSTHFFILISSLFPCFPGADPYSDKLAGINIPILPHQSVVRFGFHHRLPYHSSVGSVALYALFIDFSSSYPIHTEKGLWTDTLKDFGMLGRGSV